MDHFDVLPRPAEPARRRAADQCAAAIAAQSADATASVEPGIEQPLRTITHPGRLAANVLEVADAAGPGTVASYRTGSGGLLAVAVHGATWSLVLRRDWVAPGQEEAARSASTWLLPDGFQDEDDQPLSFCPDGEGDVDRTPPVDDVLTLIDPHPLAGTRTWPRRRGGHRPRHRPGPDPRTAYPTGAPPNRAGQAP